MAQRKKRRILPFNGYPRRNTSGWMNYKTATRLDVTETDTAYTVRTLLYGIAPESLEVDWQGDYLFVRGILRGDGTRKQDNRRGCYVRHLPLDDRQPGKPKIAQFDEDGALVIVIPKAAAVADS